MKFYLANVCLIMLKIMATFTTLAKFILKKVAGLDEIFIQRKLYAIQIHTCTVGAIFLLDWTVL